MPAFVVMILCIHLDELREARVWEIADLLA
jgi:hypothetical protein